MNSADACHCGQPFRYGYDGDPNHHRGMCADCDAVRCDAYPGACRQGDEGAPRSDEHTTDVPADRQASPKPPRRRWRISRDRDPGTRPWLVDRPDCEGDADSHEYPCWEYETWDEALAHVNDQIRARALTALEGQP